MVHTHMGQTLGTVGERTLAFTGYGCSLMQCKFKPGTFSQVF